MYEFKSEGFKPRFIEDITPPKPSPYANIRDERVRRQSIGYLDAQYMKHRAAGSNLDLGEHMYSRVPPLTNLNQATQPNLDAAGESFASLVRSVGAGIAASALYISRSLRALPWLPKKYALAKGVYVDWHTRTFKQGRWTLPALLLSGGILAAMLPFSGPSFQEGIRHPRVAQSQFVNSQASDSTPDTAIVNDGSSTSSWNVPPGSSTSSTANASDSTIQIGPVVLTPDPTTIGEGTVPTVEAPPVTVPEIPVTTPEPDPTPTDPIAQIINDPLAPVLGTVDSLL